MSCLLRLRRQRRLTLPLPHSDIITKASFENAIAMITILGGSTNSVLHLIAMARSAGISLTTDDFTRIGDRTPVLGNLKPSGDYVFEDLHLIGGIPSVLKYLLANSDLIDGSQMTVTGKTLAENVADGELDVSRGQCKADLGANSQRPTSTSRSRTSFALCPTPSNGMAIS